jgi:hypothetical protein
MCRNIRPLFNFDPPASVDEVRAASLQFVRKISGYNAPSAVNKAAFDRAVAEVSSAAAALLASLETSSPPKDRDEEAAKARERAKVRYVRIA